MVVVAVVLCCLHVAVPFYAIIASAFRVGLVFEFLKKKPRIQLKKSNCFFINTDMDACQEAFVNEALRLNVH